MSTRTVCLALAAILATAGAHAQTPHDLTPHAPAAPDAHPGGHAAAGVDLATFQARHLKRVMRADADHDGRVSRAEWTAWWEAHPGKGPSDPAGRFRAIDADSDGFITAAEVDAMTAKRFARLDADHDGHVVRAERPCRAP